MIRAATTDWAKIQLRREVIRLLRLAGLAAMVAAFTSTLAAQDATPPEPYAPGFYAGGELGTLFNNACEPPALSCDHSTWAAAAFGGYRFNSHLALELGYRDLGEARAVYPRLTSTIDVTGHVHGYEPAALVSFPINRVWQAYFRGGAFYWDAATRSSEFHTAESGWSPAVGAGFAWQFRPWQARVQYLYLAHVGGTQTGESNDAILSIGLSYVFGGHP